MSGRRRFAVVATPLLALLGVAAAILWPAAAAPAAAQSTEPAVVCFEITVGWRICAAPAVAPAEGALAQNDLTGCQPRAPAGGRSDDVADLGLEDCGLPSTTLSYGAPTTTGSVTDDGSYAFLTDPDDLTTAITTYEGLRTGLRDGTTIGLVMHQSDGHGASHEAFYDLVEEGDVVEWREADGCWMRYVIREVHADPTGDPPRTLLTLQIYSHPYPDTGCTGAIRTTGSRTFTWTPGEFATGNLPAPVWHGDALWAPRGWSGTLPDAARITPIDTTWPLDPMPAPDLGAAWSGYLSLGYGGVIEGYYGHTDGGVLSVLIYRARLWPGVVMGVATDRATAAHIWELRVIDGWPAAVGYDRVRSDISYAAVDFYDAANGTIYVFHGGSVAQRNDPEALIALARQFLPAAPAGSCQPRAPAGGRSNAGADLGLEDCGLPSTTLTYGAPTTTGSVTDDGDYAFLTDPDDLTTLVSTYEGLRTGLRDGTTIGLVLHQNDGDGASHEAFYDLVEEGDLVEWREAADCWVRYQVDEVHADPTGDPPRKLLTIQVYSYAYTGCSGTIDTTGTRTFTWTPENIRTGNIPAPLYHGPYVFAPKSWTGALPALERITPIETTWPPDPLPNADLGSEWTGGVSAGGPDDGNAVFVTYWHTSEWRLEGLIYRLPIWPLDAGLYNNDPADFDDPTARYILYELRVVDGFPAVISYAQVTGVLSNAGVRFYDADSGVVYAFSGGTYEQRNDPDALIELARQFLPGAP